MLRANDSEENTATKVIVKFMRYLWLILTRFENLRSIDTTYVVPIIWVILDKKNPKLNHTIEDVFSLDLVDLTFYRKVLRDLVVGMILFHKDIIFHGEMWKLIETN